jgi:hypothetical protein
MVRLLRREVEERARTVFLDRVGFWSVPIAIQKHPRRTVRFSGIGW